MNKKRVRGNEGEYTFGDPETSNMRRLNEFDEVNFLLGNMAFRSVLSRPAWISNFEPSIRRGFGVLNDDLTGTLTLLEAHECCSAGADLPAVGSVPRGFGAEGVD
jgi:hypothetical protein